MNVVPESCINCQSHSEIYVRMGSLEILPAGQTAKTSAGMMCCSCKAISTLSILEPPSPSRVEQNAAAEELYRLCFKTKLPEPASKSKK